MQIEENELRRLAQTNVLNTLLLHEEGELREYSFHVLTDLGNFPGLSYSERAYGVGDQTLIGRMNRKVLQALYGAYKWIARGAHRLSEAGVGQPADNPCACSFGAYFGRKVVRRH